MVLGPFAETKGPRRAGDETPAFFSPLVARGRNPALYKSSTRWTSRPISRLCLLSFVARVFSGNPVSLILSNRKRTATDGWCAFAAPSSRLGMSQQLQLCHRHGDLTGQHALDDAGGDFLPEPFYPGGEDLSERSDVPHVLLQTTGTGAKAPSEGPSRRAPMSFFGVLSDSKLEGPRRSGDETPCIHTKHDNRAIRFPLRWLRTSQRFWPSERTQRHAKRPSIFHVS